MLQWHQQSLHNILEGTFITNDDIHKSEGTVITNDDVHKSEGTVITNDVHTSEGTVITNDDIHKSECTVITNDNIPNHMVITLSINLCTKLNRQVADALCYTVSLNQCLRKQKMLGKKARKLIDVIIM